MTNRKEDSEYTDRKKGGESTQHKSLLKHGRFPLNRKNSKKERNYKMKKFLSLILAICMTMVICVPSAYAEETDANVAYISFEEYSAAIEAEYAKYGIEGGVYEPEGEFICTSEDLETSLAIIRENIETKSKGAGNVVVLEEAESSDYLNPSIMPTVMPVTVTMSTNYFYANLDFPLIPRGCTIKTTVNITVNVQSSNILSVGIPSLKVENGIGIADWVEYVSHSSTINQSNNSVTMYVTCRLKFETSLGVTTAWSTETISYSTTFKNIPV